MKPKTYIQQVKELGFRAFRSHDYPGCLAIISAEHGDDAADYYGEFRGGRPWINPKIEAFAKANGLRIEWMNPGALGLYSE